MKPYIGVLALQGGVSEHVNMLRSIGCSTVEVRLPKDLSGVHGLIIPGGESTALIRLLIRWNLITPIKNLAEAGVPVWGTCAGAILLSSEITEKSHSVDQPSLELAPVRAERNSFGRQAASFQENLVIKGLEEPFPGVFIRAPLLFPLSDKAEVLCSVKEGAVFIRSGNIWLSSFHPELTGDTRIHTMFVEGAVVGSQS
ncbi:MAG: glutamine amidotransferase subunit PdxT [Gemmatimonadaceae bacterium 4484_173]|nr:MAG: glutamine amidotransferase subunit PdxT [Gemmatimonadaceae bacterium 4484_173]RKZ01657.1 MAG: pyridoxal 5'-phosphate synthase glutaminase subunit PdxT [Candidatus Fermentibacteria bacterium]